MKAKKQFDKSLEYLENKPSQKTNDFMIARMTIFGKIFVICLTDEIKKISHMIKTCTKCEPGLMEVLVQSFERNEQVLRIF